MSRPNQDTDKRVASRMQVALTATLQREQEQAIEIVELKKQLDAVRNCQTYVVELDDREQEWFKKADVLKAIGDSDE